MINNNIEEESVTLVFRLFGGLGRLLPNPVVKKKTLTFDQAMKQEVGYDYIQSSARTMGTSIFYEETVLIPGNRKNKFGWIKETKSLLDSSKSKREIFNANGELMQTFRHEIEDKSPVESSTSEDIGMETTLLDKTGKLEVAQVIVFINIFMNLKCFICNNANSFYWYSETCVNGHLLLTTTCLQRPA
jgi:hypothetical protein